MPLMVLIMRGSHYSLQWLEAKPMKKRDSRVWNIFIYNLWDNQTLSNNNDLKRSLSRCCQGHNFYD